MKDRIQTIIWAILLSLGICSVANAQSQSDLKKIQLGGMAGLFLPSDSDEFETDNPDFDFDSFDFDSGFGGSVYGGYRFNNEQARYLNAFSVYEITSANNDDEEGFSSFSLEAGLNFTL